MAALCDIHEGRLNATGDRFGIERRYADYRQMVEEIAPDAVYVIGQPHIMYDLWTWCLKQGQNLYIAWTGDPVGRWEGDTLVVETRGLHPGAAWRMPSRLYLSKDARVVERFTRVAPGALRYDFTVEDPAIFTRPWRAETVMQAATAPMFEYACHEGNYSLSGVLAGARRAEREATAR
jgi:hypothetical protein